MGNQSFIRASTFTGLVAQLLKQGQPGMFLNFKHCCRRGVSREESGSLKSLLW